MGVATARTILVVDDEPFICSVIEDALADWDGTAVTRAEDALSGGRYLKASHFDLALIDALLPGESGISLARRAAQQDIPVILLSGHPAVVEKLERFGCPHLSKPFRIDELLAASKLTIAETRENVIRVRQSLEQLKASGEVLTDLIAVSNRVVQGANEERR